MNSRESFTPTNPFCNKHGFSIAELLVAMTIMAIITIILGQTLILSGKIWKKGESNKGGLANIHSVYNFIAMEAQAALLPLDRTSQSNLQFVINPADVSFDYKNRDCFFWQTPIAQNSSYGDIVEVGYFIKWDTSHPNNPKSILCRFLVNPFEKVSFNRVKPNPNFLIYTNPDSWINDRTIKSVSPANHDYDYKGLFIENVVGMWIDPLTPEGESIHTNHEFDSRKGYHYVDRRPNLLPLTVLKRLPAAIDLSMAFIDQQTASLITPLDQQMIINATRESSNANDFLQIILKNNKLKKIHSGLQICHTKIYFPISK